MLPPILFMAMFCMLMLAGFMIVDGKCDEVGSKVRVKDSCASP